MSKTDREIAEDHWEYTRECIRDGRDEDSWVHLTVRDYLTNIGDRYQDAMVHGIKHGEERTNG